MGQSHLGTGQQVAVLIKGDQPINTDDERKNNRIFSQLETKMTSWPWPHNSGTN